MFVKHVPSRVTKGNRRVKEGVEVYRTLYKPGEGTKQVYLARYTLPYGSLPTEPPSSLTERLTDSEREQLSVWWQEFREKRESEREARDRKMAVEDIKFAARSLERLQPEDLSQEERETLEEGIAKAVAQAERLLGKTTKRKPAARKTTKKADVPKENATLTKQTKTKTVKKGSSKPPLPAGAAKPKKVTPTLARVSSVLKISGDSGGEA